MTDPRPMPVRPKADGVFHIASRADYVSAVAKIAELESAPHRRKQPQVLSELKRAVEDAAPEFGDPVVAPLAGHQQGPVKWDTLRRQ